MQGFDARALFLELRETRQRAKAHKAFICGRVYEVCQQVEKAQRFATAALERVLQEAGLLQESSAELPEATTFDRELDKEYALPEEDAEFEDAVAEAKRVRQHLYEDERQERIRYPYRRQTPTPEDKAIENYRAAVHGYQVADREFHVHRGDE